MSKPTKPTKKTTLPEKEQLPAHKPIALSQTAKAPAAAKHGLGRGLNALISHPAPVASATVQKPLLARDPASGAMTSPVAHALPHPGKVVIDVPTHEIHRSPWQPRQTFDETLLAELTESIRTNGVIQPLICRKDKEGRYELIAGERRLRASINAGQAKVPVVLLDAEDRRAAEMAIIENIQRQDLNIIEEAEGYRTLAESFSLTQQEVADQVGKARASVANALRLLDLPDEVKQLLGSGQLSPGHAKVLLGLTDTTEQTVLGRKCVLEGLTVRSLEKLIQRRKECGDGTAERRAGKSDLPESYVRDLVDRLHRHFGTAIRLTPSVTHENGRHTKGLLEIDFYGNEDLDRLISILGISVD